MPMTYRTDQIFLKHNLVVEYPSARGQPGNCQLLSGYQLLPAFRGEESNSPR